MGPRRTTLVLALLALGLLVASAGVAAASSGAGGQGHWDEAASDTAASQPLDPATGQQATSGADPAANAGTDSATDAPKWKSWDQGQSDHGQSDDGHQQSAEGHSGDGKIDGDADDGDATPPEQGGVSVAGVGTGAQDVGAKGHDTGTSKPTGSSDGDGGVVNGASVGTPPAPVEAPVTTASGPAPDAVVTAPIIPSVADVIAAVTPIVSNDVGIGGTGTDTAAAVNDVASLPTSNVAANGVSLASLPVLGSIGAEVARASDPAAVPRELIASAPGRSIAIVLALLGAILLFLAIHRLADRGDPKLLSARTGPDLARFR